MADWIEDFDYKGTSTRLLRRSGYLTVVANLLCGAGVVLGLHYLFRTRDGVHRTLGLGWGLLLLFAALLCLVNLASAVLEGVAKNLRGTQLLLDRSATERSVSGRRPGP